MVDKDSSCRKYPCISHPTLHLKEIKSTKKDEDPNRKYIEETDLLFNNKISLIFKWIVEVAFLETFAVNYD